MIWFFTCVALLCVGYFFYSKFVEKVFKIDPNRLTPAKAINDGVDYVPMPKTKIWLIQLLNIAGTGPIFGPILGALYGPVAMLWIVFGCVFAGAVHDYICAMMSVRNNGDNIPALGGKYVGPWIKHFINVLAVVLLLLVGVVFVASPASLLTNISDELIRTGTLGASVVNDAEVISATGEFSKGNILIFWTTLIFLYYILATLLPIDKIIGKIYPYFGGLLMFMTFGMLFGMLFEGIPLFQTYGTDLSITDFFTNFYPAGEQAKNPIWPILFITVACGAVSGFHATQTPLMARCVENEKEARFVFYGAMITEGIIALIWCMVGVSFYDDRIALQEAIAAGSPSKVVYDSAISMLGWFGGLLAILGVVILPITSGDTAFRAARLIISDFLNYSQKKLTNRLVISIPLFVVGFIVSKIDFSILWRYFGWANQATAAVTLWIAAAYLLKMRKLHWICTIPAMFMTMVCATYLFFAEIGFKLSYDVSVYCSMALTLVISVAFFLTIKPMSKEEIEKL